jgi:hypothetical protein
MKVKCQISPNPAISVVPENRKDVISADHKNYTFAEFAELVGKNNHSYNNCNHVPIVKNDILVQNNSTAVSYQILSLDFDGKSVLPPNQVIDLLKSWVGFPNLIYLTKRNPPELCEMHNAERFRVVFFLDNEIPLNERTLDERTRILHYFKSLFPSLDSSVFDTNRFFFGGKKILYTNFDSALNYHLVLSLGNTFEISSKSPKRFKEQLGGLNNILDQKTEKYIYNNIDSTVFETNVVKWSAAQWEVATTKVPLLRNFFEAKVKVFHPELVKLFFALDKIEGGLKRWKKAVEANVEINKTEKVNSIFHYFKKRMANGEVFFELPIRSITKQVDEDVPLYLSELFKSKSNSKTALVGDASSHKLVERDLEDVRGDLFNNIDTFFKEGGKVLLKAPTGVGKTYSVIDLIAKNKKFRKGTIWAFPRHDLLMEQAKCLYERKIEFMAIKQLPNINSILLNKQLSLFYNNGFISLAKQLIESVAEDKTSVIEKYQCEEDVEPLKEYLAHNEKVLASKGLVLTTHQSAIRSDWKNHSRLIIDENPTDTLLNIHEVDYLLLSKHMDENEKLKTHFEKMKKWADTLQQQSSSNNFQCFIPEKKQNRNDFSNSISLQNIAYLLQAELVLPKYNSDGQLESLVAASKYSINGFGDILIMSATANHKILKNLIPDLVENDLGMVKNVGKLFQFCDQNFSKYSLRHLQYEENFNEFFEKMKDLIGNTVLISHNIEFIKNIFPITYNFHNTSGLNSLQSADCIVFGTEFPPPFLIIAIAKLCKIPFENSSMESLRLHRYGVSFSLYTYKDIVLQEIHLSFMEELLLQAIGRARLVTNKRKVVVFSKIPLAQSIKYVNNDYAEILDTLFKADVTGSSNVSYNTVETPPVYQFPNFKSVQSQEGIEVIEEYINEMNSIKNNSNDDSVYFKVSKQTNF